MPGEISFFGKSYQANNLSDKSFSYLCWLLEYANNAMNTYGTVAGIVGLIRLGYDLKPEFECENANRAGIPVMAALMFFSVIGRHPRIIQKLDKWLRVTFAGTEVTATTMFLTQFISFIVTLVATGSSDDLCNKDFTMKESVFLSAIVLPAFIFSLFISQKSRSMLKDSAILNKFVDTLKGCCSSALLRLGTINEANEEQPLLNNNNNNNQRSRKEVWLDAIGDAIGTAALVRGIALTIEGTLLTFKSSFFDTEKMCAWFPGRLFRYVPPLGAIGLSLAASYRQRNGSRFHYRIRPLNQYNKLAVDYTLLYLVLNIADLVLGFRSCYAAEQVSGTETGAYIGTFVFMFGLPIALQIILNYCLPPTQNNNRAINVSRNDGNDEIRIVEESDSFTAEDKASEISEPTPIIEELNPFAELDVEGLNSSQTQPGL